MSATESAVPTGPGRCELGEVTVGWVLHALEPDDEQRLVEHLPQCPECRRTLREAREVCSMIAASVPAHDPPPDLRERVLAAAHGGDDAVVDPPAEWAVLALAEPTHLADRLDGADRPGGDTVRPPGPGRPARRPRTNGASTGPPDARPPAPRRAGPLSGITGRGLAIVVGACVLIVGLALGGRSVSTPPDSPPALAQRADRIVGDAESHDPAVRTATLRLPSGAPAAVVLDNGSGPRVVPVGLPPLDQSREYVLWRLGTGPAPAAVGTVGPQGLAGTETSPPAGGAARSVAAYAVSSEPAGPPPPSPTVVVAIGPVV